MANGGNFAVWNHHVTGTRSNLLDGSLTLDATSTDLAGSNTTIGITTGKWYWEMYITKGAGGGGGYIYVGLSPGYEGGGEYYQGYAHLNGMVGSTIRWENNGDLSDDSSSDDPDRWGTITLNSTGMSTYADGDILQVALDYDNKKVWFGKNGTFINSGNPATGTNQQASWDGNVPIIYPTGQPYATGNDITINAGQDPTFAGRKSTGSANAADSNSRGSFYYTPPTNYLALCSGNLPASTDIDPAETSDDIPSKQFNVVNYTGTGTARSVTGFGFKPDMVWIKNKASPGDQAPRIVDSSRGVSKAMIPSDSQAENTETTAIQTFDNDGFTLGSVLGGYNTNTGTYVAWGWKANGGTTSTSTAGTTTSTVQANTKSGFSIIQYAGNSTAGSTIGHGLTAAPDFILFKALSGGENWAVYHRTLGGTKALILNTTSAEVTNSNRFNDTDPSATVITLGTVGNTNETGKNYIAYAWHNVEGYSKFSTFNGNGNASGPFVYTGFRPRLVFIKKSSSTGHWTVADTARGGETGTVPLTNPLRKVVDWDADYAEYGTGTRDIEAYSNGFKVRTSDAEINGSEVKYVYGAWGDVPFKYGNTI